MKIFIAFVLLTLICGCQVSRTFTGKYTSKGGSFAIQFHKDSTFSFEGRANHFYQRSTGKWKRVNNRLIIMNSDIKNIEVPLSVSRMDEKSVDSENVISLVLKMKGGTNLSDFRCLLFVDDELFDNKRGDSITSIEIKKPVKNISFQILREPQLFTSNRISDPLYSQKYSFKDPLNNRLKIEMTVDESHFFYRVFDQNPVKGKNGKIRLFNTDRKKWATLFRVRDGANIFFDF